MSPVNRLTSKVRVGGQCEGYSGLFMALQQNLDVEHAWYAEIDPGASKILAHHYPGVPNHGDITAFDWTTAEKVGVFTSGFPCTDFSLAGKRAGSGGENFLWPRGVKPAVAALRPLLALFENVPNLLRIENGQVFAQILADLDDLGYTVSWTTVGACRVGACHHRHRVFIAATLTEVRAPMSDPVAHRAGIGWSPAQCVLFGDTEAVRWPASGFTRDGTVWELPADICGPCDPALPTPVARDHKGANIRGDDSCLHGALLPTPRVSDTNGAGQHGHGGSKVETAVAMLPGADTIAQMLPTPTVADSRGSHNATAGRSVTASSKVNAGWTLSDVVYDGQIQSMRPTPRASDADKGGPNQQGSSGDVMLPAAVQPGRFGRYAAAVRRHELAYGLAVPDPTEPGRNGKPRLSAAFPEWMMGLPAGWLTDVVDRKAALRAAGNGVNPRQATYALSLLPTFRAAAAALASPALAVAA